MEEYGVGLRSTFNFSLSRALEKLYASNFWFFPFFSQNAVNGCINRCLSIEMSTPLFVLVSFGATSSP